MTSVMRSAAQLRATFDKKTEVRDGCLIWTGAVDSDGYPKIPVGCRPQTSSTRGGTITGNARRIYQQVVLGKEIPDGAHMHHTCPNRRCLIHLEVGRAGAAKRSPRGASKNPRRASPPKDSTKYPCGHPRTEENTLINKQRKQPDLRVCKTCTREYQNRYNHTRRGRTPNRFRREAP